MIQTIIRKCSTSSKFRVVQPGESLLDSSPQFLVGTKNGFLPRQAPLCKLPKDYERIDDLLGKMPYYLEDGSKGLLAHGTWSSTVERELPKYDFSDITNSRVLSALYRDYAFMTSAYLLEDCHLSYLRDETYGLGKSVLPENLAIPFSQLAKKHGCRPFMEYNMHYALYNYDFVDLDSDSYHINNLKLVRKLNGCKSEAGFILTHVSIVQYSGKVVSLILDTMDAVANNNREKFNSSLKELTDIAHIIVATFDDMWANSDAVDYQQFRTYIMGIKNQPMFPNGVVYKGVSSEPIFPRGESGANDSIVPSIDNMLEMTAEMPDNILTNILRDFRSYRPSNHNQWLTYVENRAKELKIREYATQNATSCVCYLAALDSVRAFRELHWRLTKEYILTNSRHPVATGGSPIITWLPNQLSAVMRTISKMAESVNTLNLSGEYSDLYDTLVTRASVQRRVLAKEVDKLKDKYPGQHFDES